MEELAQTNTKVKRNPDDDRSEKVTDRAGQESEKGDREYIDNPKFSNWFQKMNIHHYGGCKAKWSLL